mgnify:FL=1
MLFRSNNQFGAGIAGVASTYTGPSILSYGDRTHFNEWEFVWVMQQGTLPGATPGNVPGGQAPANGQAPTNGQNPRPNQPAPGGFPPMTIGTPILGPGTPTPPTR